MRAALLAKLDAISYEYKRIEMQLGDQLVASDTEQFAVLSKQFADLELTYSTYQAYKQALAEKAQAEAMLADPEYAELAQEEISQLLATTAQLEQQLKIALVPKNPEDDACALFIEIRAAAGGDESCLFAADLLRMYCRFAEQKGYQYEITNKHEGTQGGFKEVVLYMRAKSSIYGILKFESGAHRVQRVPATESQGRIHTSTCTVAVLPEVDDFNEVDIQKDDLRIDTFRSSGAGGQHVNTTDSAVRITHIPTGVVAECQQERSQHKNKAKAMALLKTKINDAMRSQQEAQQAHKRKSLVGTGDRSERIRTYNFPQGRMTDHRINLTLYRLDSIMEGNIDEILNALQVENNELAMAEMKD